jgi:hypothetical protein
MLCSSESAVKWAKQVKRNKFCFVVLYLTETTKYNCICFANNCNLYSFLSFFFYRWVQEFMHEIDLPSCVSNYYFASCWNVALGGVVVSVLATGPKVRGFKPGRERWVLRMIKSVGARRQNSAAISHPCFPASPLESLVVTTRCLWWLNQGV